jgi:hypothetical protein
MMMLQRRLFGVLGILVAGGIRCGDGLVVTNHARIAVEIDDLPVSDDPASLTTVEFAQAIQGLPVTRTVTILNDGTQPLTVSQIDWATYDAALLTQAGGEAADFQSGDLMVNKRVALVNLPEAPLQVSHTDAIGVSFEVRFTPPVEGALDDQRPSILAIHSNAKTFDGKHAVPVIYLGLNMPKEAGFPIVEPPNYKFTNATQVSPDSQTFQIGNDPQLGTGPFKVMAVYLEYQSTEFVLTDLPNQGTLVLPANDPGYQPASFSVKYQPFDDGAGDANAVIVETDVGAPKRVPLSTSVQTAAYSVSWSHIQQFDFGDINTKESRRVSVQSVGDAPLTIKKLASIEPPEARAWFTWKGILPPTSPEDPEIVLADDDYPRVIKKGKSIDFEITFAPPTGGGIPYDGYLEVPFDPGGQTMLFELFAGVPKGRLEVAPSISNVLVSPDLSADPPPTGKRVAVLYNTGNGVLTVNDIVLTGKFKTDKPKLFSLANFPGGATTLDPGGILVLELAWDAAGLPQGATTYNDTLWVDYHNDYTGEDTTATLSLILVGSGGSLGPTASYGDAALYAGAKVGNPVYLQSGASTAGDFDFQQSSHVWVLLSKPAGSRLVVNGTTGPSLGSVLSFTPDTAGPHVLELFTWTYDEAAQLTLTSAPVQLTIDVTE